MYTHALSLEVEVDLPTQTIRIEDFSRIHGAIARKLRAGSVAPREFLKDVSGTVTARYAFEFEYSDEIAREGSANLAEFNEKSGRGELTGPVSATCPTCLRDKVQGHHGCFCED